MPMRYLSLICFAVLMAVSSSVRAADPNQIFGTILGEINRQIERKQQKQQIDRLRPLWTACSKGDVAACDSAAQFPNLTDQARAEIARMRSAAEQRPEYERNFYACQKMNQAACEAALRYRNASDVDRSNLQNWQRAAIRQQALLGFRQDERNCYAGSVAACDAALARRELDEGAASRVQDQRARLLFAEERRQLQERQQAAARQHALAAFRQDERNCYAGSIAACDAALAQRQLDEGAARRVQTQRGRLQIAEQQRQLREKERAAALRAYAALRQACASGERAACKTAASHTQMPHTDMAFLKRRDRELAPITERVVNFFANIQSRGTVDSLSSGAAIQALLGLFAFLGAVIGVRQVLRNRVAPARLQADEPPGFEPKPSSKPSDHFGGQTFPLTGHMPTDVRRALNGS